MFVLTGFQAFLVLFWLLLFSIVVVYFLAYFLNKEDEKYDDDFTKSLRESKKLREFRSKE